MVEDSGIASDGAAWVAAARADTLVALGSMRTATARQLGKAVPALTEKLHLAVGKSYAASQGAHTRVLLNLGFDGAIVRGRPSGAWNSSEYPWALAETWLPGGIIGDEPVDAHVAAAELARAYVAEFGPVTIADLQWWAGWTMGTTRRALAAIEAVEVDVEAEVEDGVGWVLPDDLGEGHDDVGPWLAFLPALDPTTMGWKQRRWYLGDLGTFGGALFDRSGNAGPTIWVDGQVVGGWAQRKSGEVVYRLLADVPANRERAIAAEAERLRRLIGEVQVNVRFPAPMQKDLLA
jgi:hypothetical protein